MLCRELRVSFRVVCACVQSLQALRRSDLGVDLRSVAFLPCRSEFAAALRASSLRAMAMAAGSWSRRQEPLSNVDFAGGPFCPAFV